MGIVKKRLKRNKNHSIPRGECRSYVKCQKLHAQKRFSKRLGWIITNKEYNEIINIIQEGISTPIKRTSPNRCQHLLMFRDVELVVVYDRKYKTIVTVWRKE